MQEKSTTELRRELEAAEDYSEFLGRNGEQLLDASASEALCALLTEKGLKKRDVIAHSDLNEIYGYQIFAGKRVPSRDKLLRLCFGMSLRPEEVQRLLKRCGMAPLYVKESRDSLIYYALDKGQSLMELNLALYEAGKRTL